MMFWVKHIGLALALIIIAGIVISLQDRASNAPRPAGAKEKTDISKSMTSFYSEYRLSSNKPHKDDLGDFVMKLNNADQAPLNDRLEAMESNQKPVSGRWVGEHKYRTFIAGTTLREAISSYAQEEGMQVIWELNQDFIVKSQFQMDDTIVGSLHTIAKTVDSNFDGLVQAYVCPRTRSLVITTEETAYLTTHCSLTTGGY